MANPAYQLNYLFRSLVRMFLSVEKWLAISLYLWLTDAFLGLYAQQGYGIVIRLRFYLWKLYLLAVVVLLLLRWSKTFPVIKNAKYILIFVGYVWLSHLWSPVPGDTKFQAQRLIDTTILGIYFASRYNFREQTRMLGITFGIGAIFSLIYVFIFPGMAIMNDAIAGLHNAWRGVYIHKNTLGRIMVIGIMFFLTNALTAPPPQRRIWWIVFAVGIQLVLGCTSKAALVSMILLLGISPLHRIFRWNLAIAIPIYLIVLMLSYVFSTILFDNWASAMGIIDKDPGLNGRLDIWLMGLDYIPQRPWLGWGYHGFWRMWSGPEHAKILRTIATWEPPDGHQGFMDLVIELGFVGAFLFSLPFFNAFAKAIQWLRAFPSVEGVWPIGMMTYYIIMNLTQSQLLPAYTIYWILLTTINSTPLIVSEKSLQSQSIDRSPPSKISNIIRHRTIRDFRRNN